MNVVACFVIESKSIEEDIVFFSHFLAFCATNSQSFSVCEKKIFNIATANTVAQMVKWDSSELEREDGIESFNFCNLIFVRTSNCSNCQVPFALCNFTISFTCKSKRSFNSRQNSHQLPLKMMMCWMESRMAQPLLFSQILILVFPLPLLWLLEKFALC